MKHENHKLAYAGQQQESCSCGVQANDKADSVGSRAESICMLPHSLFQVSAVDRRHPVLLVMLVQNVKQSWSWQQCNEIVE